MRVRTRFGNFKEARVCFNSNCRATITKGIIHLVAPKYTEYFCNRKCLVAGKCLCDDFLKSEYYPILGEPITATMDCDLKC